MQFQLHENSTQSVIKKLIRDFQEDDLYIAIPAKIMGIEDYETLQVVTVKPCIDLTYPEWNDTKIVSNTLKKVFVKLPSSGGFSITMPVAIGDLCTLHWSHRDLNSFLDGSGEDVTQSKRYITNIEDCWVELGFGTRKNHQNPSATDLVIKSENTTITLTPTGEVSIETTGTSTVKSALHTIDTNAVVTGNIVAQGSITSQGNSTIVGNTSLTGTLAVTGNITSIGNLDFTTLSNAGVAGVSGTFTSQYGSITIVNGIITAIA